MPLAFTQEDFLVFNMCSSVYFFWCIHTGCNRDREIMGCLKMCASILITPGPGQGLIPIVAHRSFPRPCSSVGPDCTQCEYPFLFYVNTSI